MAAEQKVEARPRRWLIPVVLVLLRDENSYGYELMDRMEEEFGFEQIDPGSVYRTLRQMEKEGLCSSEWDVVRAEEGSPPPRRMYAVTDGGKRTWRLGPKRARSTTESWTSSPGSTDEDK